MEVVSESEILVKLDQERIYEHVDLNSQFVPAQITGLAMMNETIKTPLHLAISVNGIIRSVTRTYPHKDTMHEWSTIVPESSFQTGKNNVEVFHLVPESWISYRGAYEKKGRR